MGDKEIADRKEAGGENARGQQQRRQQQPPVAEQAGSEQQQSAPRRQRVGQHRAQIPELLPAQHLQHLAPTHGQVGSQVCVVHAVVTLLCVGAKRGQRSAGLHVEQDERRQAEHEKRQRAEHASQRQRGSAAPAPPP